MLLSPKFDFLPSKITLQVPQTQAEFSFPNRFIILQGQLNLAILSWN